MYGFIPFIQHCARKLSQCNKPRKKKKSIQSERKEIKSHLFPNDAIIYICYGTESVRKLLEVIAEVSKHVVYTIDTQNSILFIHASIEHMDTKIKDTVLFTISQKNT